MACPLELFTCNCSAAIMDARDGSGPPNPVERFDMPNPEDWLVDFGFTGCGMFVEY